MHSSSRRFALALSVVGAAFPVLTSAQERTFTLDAPNLAVSEPFTQVSGVGELRDGRLVVVDSRERLVKIVDRTGTSATTFSAQGEGPFEYRRPFGLNRLPGDSIVLYDAQGRYYVLSPDGAPAREFRVSTTILQRGGLAPPRVDSQGRFYWSGDVVTMNAQGVKRNQTQNVRRWTPPSEVVDTVAVIADHAPAMTAHKFHPFAERDAFVIASDGRVGVLSARDYRLRWYKDGQLVSEGPALPHTDVPVSPETRVAFRRERAQGGGAQGNMVSASGLQAGPSPAALKSAEENYPDAMFPRSMPPFTENGVHITPGQDIWVTRSRAKSSDSLRIDVLSPDGARRGHMVLPADRRLVGFAKGGVYLTRTDEDGLEWLERRAWPAGLR